MSGSYMANTYPPTQDQVIKQCKYVLSLDDTDDVTPIPAFLINEISRFMAKNPHDDNFVLELEAGNGFGIATCVDDNCYCDIILPPSPRSSDGGRSTGLGDLDAYATHCLEYAHVQARDARVKKRQEAEKRKLTKLLKRPSLGSSQGSSTTSMLVPQASLADSKPKPARHPSTSTFSLGAGGSNPNLVRQSSLTFSKNDNKPKLTKQLSATCSQTDSKPILARQPSSDTIFPGAQPKLASHVNYASSTNSQKKYMKHSNSPPTPGPSNIPQSPRDAVRNAWANKDLITLGRSEDVKPGIKDDDVEMDHVLYLAPGPSRKRQREDSRSTQAMHLPRQERTSKKLKPLEFSSDSEVEFVSAKKSLEETGRIALAEVKQEDDVVFAGENVAPPKPEVVAVESRVNPSVQQNVIPRTMTYIEETTADNFIVECRTLSTLMPHIRNPTLRCVIAGRQKNIAINLMRRRNRQPYNFTLPSPALLRALPQLNQVWPPHLNGEYEMEGMAIPAAPENAVAGPSNAAEGASSLFSHLSKAVGGVAKSVMDAFNVPVPSNLSNAERFARLQEQINNPRLNTGWSAPQIPGGLPWIAGGSNLALARVDLPGEPREMPMATDELTKFLVEALNDFDDNATVAESAEYLGLASLHASLPNSSIKLMPHQIIGVAWMTRQEKHPKIQGGLLADSMGLGKTVQALGVCLMNPSVDPQVKTTLIVAPLGLLPQWKAEIESKTVGAEVYIYHGADRDRNPKRLRRYDYILTSYGTLVTEFPQQEKRKRKPKIALNSDDETENDEPQHQNKRPHGPIAKMKFYRIILDEAHNIRNKNTQMSKACFELDATYRWALSGTLIINDFADVFPLLHFCGISAVCEWDNFRERIIAPSKQMPRLATKRLQAILKLFALRRHAQSRIEDHPILQLPPLEVTLDSLDLDPDEAAIYQTIEKRARIRINKYIAEGSMVKNYQHVLTMLLRLRQVACHPRLIVRKDGDNGHVDDLLLSKDDELFATKDQGELKPEDVLAQARRVGGQALVIKLQEVLASRVEEIALDPASFSCSICLDAFENEYITACAHSFCKICITDVMTSPLLQAGLDPEAPPPGTRPCPMCRHALTMGEIFKAEPFQPAATREGSAKEEEDELELGEESNSLPPVNGKGKGRATSIDSDDDVEDVPLSTKMRRMFELLDDWLQDDDTKCLVFSTFTGLLDLCSKAMYKRGISHEMYVGSMRTTQREDAIRNFKRPGRDAPRVCLISIKAGGVGLNLCEANKVIILDFSWTDAAERQALSRAHRIGQTKPVEVHRLAITGSVDERINALQEKKKALADGAFGEGDASKLGRLTINELVGLFGVNPRGVGLDD